MEEKTEEPQGETIVVHQHFFHFSTTSFLKILMAPVLLGGAVFAVVKTKGEYREINWLVPVFTALSIWKSI